MTRGQDDKCKTMRNQA